MSSFTLVRLFVVQSPITSSNFVKDYSSYVCPNNLIIVLKYYQGELYRVSPFQLRRRSTSCLPIYLLKFCTENFLSNIVRLLCVGLI